MPNVNPGDLCLVVGAKNTKELIGSVVTVVREAFVDDITKSSCGHKVRLDIFNEKAWWISNGKLLPWRVSCDNRLRLFNQVPISDFNLVKIKGGDLTLDEETEISKNTPLTKEKETT